MKMFTPTVIFAFCALAVALVAASLATAAYNPGGLADQISEFHEQDMIGVPEPVGGEILFAEQENGPSCISRGRVMELFLADQRAYGGEVLEIGETAQVLADNWRLAAYVSPAEVSEMVGHYFHDGQNWMVDLVEFGPAGCAMTRTLIPAGAWKSLSPNATS